MILLVGLKGGMTRWHGIVQNTILMDPLILIIKWGVSFERASKEPPESLD